MTSTSDLSLLYIGYFNRLPDSEGLAFWEGVLASGFPLADIAEDFSIQAESVAIYAYFEPVPQGTPAQFLSEVYLNLFNRAPDAAGAAFWTEYLEAGGRVGDAILTIIQGAVEADQSVLDVKLAVAELWTDALAADPDRPFDLDLGIAASRSALDQAGTDTEMQAEALDDAALFFADAPAITAVQSVSRIDEDEVTGSRIKVGELALFEAVIGEENTLVLTGADAALFEIDGTEVFLRADAAIDFATQSSLSVTVEVDDPDVGQSPDDTHSFTITLVEEPVAPVQTPPVVVSPGPTAAQVSATVIQAYANSNTNPAPSVTDYTNIGVTGVSANNLAVVNAAIDAAPNDAADVDTVPEVQALVNSALLTPAVELSALEMDTDTSGFVINGVSAGDRSGVSVSGAGDVNGDGFDDLIAGADRDDPNGSASGTSFVVFGKSDGTAVELSALEMDADNRGFVINGVSAFDYSGVSVSGAGDVNGDGFDDLIVGARYEDPNGGASGASFVVFGKGDGMAVELSAVEMDTDTSGFVINGVSAFDQSGISVSGAGDVNGDGFDDLIVGARYDDPNGSASGASFVVFGKGDGTAVELSAVEMDADTSGFVINGVSAVDTSGRSVSGAGDVNGDGFDDLIVGANRDEPNGSDSGASFVVFGKGDGAAVELSAVEMDTDTSGFVINGVSAGDLSGRSVSGAGDVNGDGFDDLIVGAYGDDPNGSASGASFVVFGKGDGMAVELSAVEAGTGGFVINGVSAFDFSGISVSGAGDVNGDGFDDLIVGAYGDDPNGNSSGASFVVFGKVDGTAIELAVVEAGTGGFVINGASAGDYSGFSVSGAGDVNGDGFDDLIVGAFRDDPNGSSSGASFVVFGGDFSFAATQVGTTAADTLTGTAAIDRLIAGTGDDVLIGTGGADVMRGGAGNDVLAVSDLGFADLDGGTGTDTLRLDGSGLTLDLDTLDNTSLSGIERINLNGGTNSLQLNAVELQRLSDSSNTLRVLGEAGDTVRLTGVFWVAETSVTDAEGTFDVFTNGAARIEVIQDIAVATDTAISKAVIEAYADSNANPAPSVTDYTNIGVTGVTANNLSAINAAIDAAPNNAADVDTAAEVQALVDAALLIPAVELSAVEMDADLSGFVINGVSANDLSGRSVSGAGDVNGDGFDDLIVGAEGDDPNGNVSGASFVVFGKGDGTAVELSAVETGSGGFVINGVSANDNSGRSVSGAGDVNGDGLDDLIVGAEGDDPNAGESGASFVIFGKSDGTAVELSAVEMDADLSGFVINGVSASDQSGFSVSGAGDVNGDGFDDLIVGARLDDPNGNASGASFVVFGKGDGTAVELSAVETGSGGFVINGVSANDLSGRSVSGAGDVNGDGFDDLIVGAYRDDPNAGESGASFVIFGKSDGTAVELSAVETGMGGFVINGVSANDQSGLSVSGAGDVNGDGFDDLIVGASGDDPNGVGSGASFVVFGKGDGTAVELSAVEAGTGGFVINGVSVGDYSGYSVSGAGDVNGDGFDDLIVGAVVDDPNGNESGASFVVFGKGDGTAVELSAVEAGSGGFVINGVSANDRSGTSVSGAGDVNGDGFDDLIIGAPDDDPNGTDSGASFVVFGGDFSFAATQVGTIGADAMTGTTGDDNIFAGTGDDTLESSAGNDRLSGGNGADTFAFLDVAGETIVTDFVSAEGDQLDLSAFGFADFTAVQSVLAPEGTGGHDTRITLDGDTSVVLIGVQSTALSAGDVILT